MASSVLILATSRCPVRAGPEAPVAVTVAGIGLVAAAIVLLSALGRHCLLPPFAAIRNQAGNYVTPSEQTVTAAAQKPAITPTDFSIVNQPGTSSYPISGYSWALVYTHQPDQARGQALVAMLDWHTHDGQAYAATNGYVPLPSRFSNSPTPCSSRSPAPPAHSS